MARWDVEVLGLDQERASAAASVAEAVARRLGAEPAQIERLLAHAPTTLVADLDEASAKSLVQELRALGVRVKPRPSATPMERPGPPAPIDPPRPPPSSSRSPLEQADDGSHTGASGLELEDIAPSSPRAAHPSTDARPISIPPRITPRVIDAPPEQEEAPRVFWTALPAAFLVPLRGPVLPGLFLAPLFMGAAVLCSILGTFMALAGVVVMSSAFIGVTLQVSHRCLWATAVGERMPASLAGGFLADYAFPGLSVVIVQGMVGGVFGWGAMVARANGVPIIAIEVASLVFGLYGVIGFALAAANRSAMGFLDIARIVRILVRAPLEVIAIAAFGAIVQGGAIAIAVVQFAAAFASGGGIGSAVLALAGSTLVVSLAASYGAALTATMMGMLFWARPEVAG